MLSRLHPPRCSCRPRVRVGTFQAGLAFNCFSVSLLALFVSSLFSFIKFTVLSLAGTGTEVGEVFLERSSRCRRRLLPAMACRTWFDDRDGMLKVICWCALELHSIDCLAHSALWRWNVCSKIIGGFIANSSSKMTILTSTRWSISIYDWRIDWKRSSCLIFTMFGYMFVNQGTCLLNGLYRFVNND